MKLISINDYKKKERDGYGCLMLYLDIKEQIWDGILSNIKQEDLYEVEGENYGLEKTPHVTILYGFHHDEILDTNIIKSISDNFTKPIKITVENVSLFENDNFDVVKFGVNSPILNDLNQYYRESFPYTNSYDKYSAHITIAYVKKGKGKDYLNIGGDGYTFKGNQIVYSKPGREPISVIIGK